MPAHAPPLAIAPTPARARAEYTAWAGTGRAGEAVGIDAHSCVSTEVALPSPLWISKCDVGIGAPMLPPSLALLPSATRPDSAPSASSASPANVAARPSLMHSTTVDAAAMSSDASKHVRGKYEAAAT